jgi:hypothetical protein
MGVDIYLRSVMTDDVFESTLKDLMAGRDGLTSRSEILETLNQYYERLAETGGYFRDPYNESGLFHAIGMQWSRDVGPMLNNGELSIDGARHLLAELDRRPIAPAMADDVLAGRGTPDPIVEWMRNEAAAELSAGFVHPAGNLDAAGFTRHLIKRRKRLMVLLRRSIELEEPLECSL